MADWICVTYMEHSQPRANVYGTFVTEGDAWAFAETLSTDPKGDVEVVQLDRYRAGWHPSHMGGHRLIGTPTNPACPYCQDEKR